MRLTWRDGAAALAVAAAPGGHLWATGNRMTEMYGAGERDHTPVWLLAATPTLGASALIGGLTAAIAPSELVLALLAQALVALWVLATACQLVAAPTHHVHRGRPRH